MRDVDDLHDAILIADGVHDAERAPPRDVQASQLALQRLPDTARIVEERTGDEFDHRCGDGLRQRLSDLATGRAGDAELPAPSQPAAEPLRRASSARTPSAST